MDETLKTALARLNELSSGSAYGDQADWHIEADDILLEVAKHLGCPIEIIEAYDSVGKWYS